MGNRFDYVAYDESAQAKQNAAKHYAKLMETCIETNLPPSAEKTLALRALEVSYMWIGKAVRDDQINRNGSAPLQESRGNE